jgi:hypothetical protein
MSLTSRRTVIARKRYKPEEIVAKLRQVDVLVSQGARELRAGSIGTSCVDHPSQSLADTGVNALKDALWRHPGSALKREAIEHPASRISLRSSGLLARVENHKSQ